MILAGRVVRLRYKNDSLLPTIAFTEVKTSRKTLDDAPLSDAEREKLRAMQAAAPLTAPMCQYEAPQLDLGDRWPRSTCNVQLTHDHGRRTWGRLPRSAARLINALARFIARTILRATNDPMRMRTTAKKRPPWEGPGWDPLKAQQISQQEIEISQQELEWTRARLICMWPENYAPTRVLQAIQYLRGEGGLEVTEEDSELASAALAKLRANDDDLRQPSDHSDLPPPYPDADETQTVVHGPTSWAHPVQATQIASIAQLSIVAHNPTQALRDDQAGWSGNIPELAMKARVLMTENDPDAIRTGLAEIAEALDRLEKEIGNPLGKLRPAVEGANRVDPAPDTSETITRK